MPTITINANKTITDQNPTVQQGGSITYFLVHGATKNAQVSPPAIFTVNGNFTLTPGSSVTRDVSSNATIGGHGYSVDMVSTAGDAMSGTITVTSKGPGEDE